MIQTEGKIDMTDFQNNCAANGYGTRNPYPLGVFPENGGIFVSFVSAKEDCGILLYDKSSGRRLKKIPFASNDRIGDVRYKRIPDVDPDKICYQFYEEDAILPDPHARAFLNKVPYGHRREEKDLKACIVRHTDRSLQNLASRPKLNYEDCICYCLHVRGFTRHFSSGTPHRGTFLGLMDKLPYLKELGITTVELQPAYEFLELPTSREKVKLLPPYAATAGILQEKKVSAKKSQVEGKDGLSSGRSALPESNNTLSSEQAGKQVRKEEEEKVNYWGYKKGYYYAPKASYAYGEDVAEEFLALVDAFHQNHMELVMQFYFPLEADRMEILDILHFWVWQYGVDGFHLMGEQLPMDMLASDPGLKDTKLWYYDFDTQKLYPDAKAPGYRNLAAYQDIYLYDCRRYLKGDAGMLPNVLTDMRCQPDTKGVINYFTNYYGFTMMDMVSYDEKHNETNGEKNRDGNDYNASWNCGVEGPTRKGRILALRRQQYKNALSMLFLSQGTPLLFMGDEFGNSQKGNNNPYCQDNEIAWLNWKDLEHNQELFSFAKELITLRRKHPILHMPKQLQMMDYKACGYPDLSYHGSLAWRPSMENYDRQIGLLYCGKYAVTENGKEDDFFYIAMNMYWEPQKIALPRLPAGLGWEKILDTDSTLNGNNKSEKEKESASPIAEELLSEAGADTNANQTIPENFTSKILSPRSIRVYRSVSAFLKA